MLRMGQGLRIGVRQHQSHRYIRRRYRLLLPAELIWHWPSWVDFSDTKRTGRPGWDTIWHGWFCLRERIRGDQLSQRQLAEL